MAGWAGLRLGGRLGVTHGALAAVSVVLFVVMLQGLLRMLGVMSSIADERLSTLDAEEDLYRSAWKIEVALRHTRAQCAGGEPTSVARARIETARSALADVFAHPAMIPQPLQSAAARYRMLADDALAADTCAYLGEPSVEARRLALDEDMTNAWIARLYELNTDLEAKEAKARQIGGQTAMIGVLVALLGAIAALFVARGTARGVTTPIARLGARATRLGDGDFAAIESVGGPPEIEELTRDLERMRDKLLGVDRLKQAFLASVSHELRSPLGRLREALALLGDGTVGPLAPKQARVLELARRACEQEVRIVDALLDMSRVGTGLPIQREDGCNLDVVVTAAIEAEREVANDRGVTLTIENKGRPPMLRLDTALVERAIANLVRNGVSVSPRGSTVRVVVDVLEKPDHRVARVDVVDSGPGFSKPERIFEPFHAAPVSQRPAGIGLGLSLAREVARAHGGDLRLADDQPHTTLRLELPTERGTDR